MTLINLPNPPTVLIRLLIDTDVAREVGVVVLGVGVGVGVRIGVVATGSTVRVTPTLSNTLLLLKLPLRTFRVTCRRVVTPLVRREMFLHVVIPTPPEVNRRMSRCDRLANLTSLTFMSDILKLK